MGTKTVHRLQLPYATPDWPAISKDAESSIVQSLVEMIKPIGDYRRRNAIPSKGKRKKKRKMEDQEDDELAKSDQVEQALMPSISNHVTVGFNSTARSLERISQRSKPAALKRTDDDMQESDTSGLNLGAVFVCRAVLPDAVTISIPLLIATASLAQPQHSDIRLVQLPTNAEGQLAEALNQPRVGFIGVDIDAPGVDVLLALVRAAVGPVHVPWLESCEKPRYLPVQIQSTETSTGVKGKPKMAAGQSQPTSQKHLSENAGPKLKAKLNARS